ERRLRRALDIFEKASLPCSPGMCPPSWDLSDELAGAMAAVGLKFVGSARDVRTPIAPYALNGMSGKKGVSLIYPERILNGQLLHVPTNFQATSPMERAREIIGLNGLVAIKAHIIKVAAGHVALDGMDSSYRDYLHALFTDLEDRYGDELWWTSMAEMTTMCESLKCGSLV